MLLVNYPFPSTDLHQKQQVARTLQIRAVCKTSFDSVGICGCYRLLQKKITIDKKPLQVNYTFPLTDLHQKRQVLKTLQFRAVCKTLFDYVWICGCYRLPQEIPLLKHKTLQVNYPFPLTDLHQKQQVLRTCLLYTSRCV